MGIVEQIVSMINGSLCSVQLYELYRMFKILRSVLHDCSPLDVQDNHILYQGLSSSIE
jgi:hypothetical protein